MDGGGFFRLGAVADPHLREGWDSSELGLGFGDALIEGGELGLLLRFDDLETRFGDAVAGGPGFTSGVGGDGRPGGSVEADLDVILGGGGTADFAFVGVTVAAGVDESDALKGFGFGEGEGEFGRIADEPGFATLAIDAVLGAVGFGEVLGGGGFGALGDGAVGGEGDVAVFGIPDLELGEFAPATLCGFGLKVTAEAADDEFDVFGLDRREGFIGAERVDFGPCELGFSEGGFGAFLDIGFELIALGREEMQLLIEGLDRCRVGGLLLCCCNGSSAMSDAFERGAEAVVVLGGDGVEFVVVAAGAVDGEAEEGAAGGGDHVVERGGADVGLGDFVLVADVIIGPGDEEGAADFDVGAVFADDVSGEVFGDELIEGFVLVDGADDVVAKGVEVVDDEVALEAVGFAEADDIQPVTSPALAVTR